MQQFLYTSEIILLDKLCACLPSTQHLIRNNKSTITKLPLQCNGTPTCVIFTLKYKYLIYDKLNKENILQGKKVRSKFL